LLIVAVGLVSLLVSIGGVSLHQPLPLLILGLGAALVLNLIGLVLVLYLSFAALRLRYCLDRNGLVIWWGASRLTVPMERIQAVMQGSQIVTQASDTPDFRVFRGISWAGLRAGRARLSDDTPARVFSTSPLAQSTVVFTPGYAYVVSPRDLDAFIEAWRLRHPLGPTQHWQEGESRGWPLDLPVWRDRVAWTLTTLSLLINLALNVYLALVFDQLPGMLSFHFNVLGQADRIASRIQILRLPQIALLLLMLDLGVGFVLYRRQRMASYLVWGGGLVLQLLVWGAVFTIIG
jgi:hypothetical protein